MALGAAIGFGAYILPFDWMTGGGLAGTLIGFLIGGSMIAVIALSYGYIIPRIPVTGGSVAYAFSSLGKHHAFIAGWALTLGYGCIVALNASAVTLVFRVTLPDLFMRLPMYEVAGWTIYLPEVLIASGFIILFAWLNTQGNVITGRFQYFAVVAMLLSVAIITMWMIAYYVIERPELAPAFPSEISPTAAILGVVAFAPWAYVGFDSIPQLAGEFSFSPKKALKLLMWGVIAATAIYWAMMISTSIAVGPNHATYEGSAWPPAEAISNVMGPFGLALMVIAVSMGVLTGLNGFLAASSRVLYIMGKSGLGPIHFAKLTEKHPAPINAIVFVAAISLISPWFGRASLTWVVDMSSAGITIAYFYACYCAYQIASGKAVRGVQHSGETSTVQAIFSLLGCILSVAFLCLLIIPGSPGALGKESWIALFIWIAMVVVFYFARLGKFKSVSETDIEKAVFQ